MRPEQIGLPCGEDAAAQQGHDPDPADAGDEQLCCVDEADDRGHADIGLLGQHRQHEPHQDRRLRNGAQPRLAGQQPGGNDGQRRLHELAGLDHDARQRQPAAGTLDLGGEEQGRAAAESRKSAASRPPGGARPEAPASSADDQKGRRCQEHDVLGDEMRAVAIEALGNGRAGGEDQDDADAASSAMPASSMRSTVHHQPATIERSVRGEAIMRQHPYAAGHGPEPGTRRRDARSS